MKISGAVGVEGEVVWTGAQGVADLESGAMLTQDTVFDIGNVTNQLTATAVLLLADEGELRLMTRFPPTSTDCPSGPMTSQSPTSFTTPAACRTTSTF